MSDRNLGQEILDSVKEIKDFRNGQKKLKTCTLKEHSPPKRIREKLELSQAAFASLLGLSARTIQDCEQGRRQPQGPAKSLLRIAESRPEILAEMKND